MLYDEVYEKTKEIITSYLRADPDEITPDTHLIDELCLDSIALVELSFRFSEVFNIPMIEGNPELAVMKQLVDYIMQKVNNSK